MLQECSARRRARFTACAMAAAAALIGTTGLGWASASSGIPVPTGNQLVRTVHGAGQQIYQCDANAASGTYSWTLLRPAAVLSNTNGAIFGFHTYTPNQASGLEDPTWIAMDGSWAQAVKAASLPSPDGPADIPWVLLQVVASGSGFDSTLTATTYVERTNTVGGIAPLTTCGTANAGATQGSDYTADYSFYKQANEDENPVLEGPREIRRPPAIGGR